MASRRLRGLVSAAGSLGRKLLLAALVFALSAGSVLAAGGGKPATTLVNVADTRNMGPGMTRWVADLYNQGHWLFGLIVVAVMVLEGAALGFLFDRLIGMLGIKLGKMDHHE